MPSLHPPGYTILATQQATRHAARAVCDRLAALTREVTNRTVSDEPLTVGVDQYVTVLVGVDQYVTVRHAGYGAHCPSCWVWCTLSVFGVW